jgi:hypothetical protein
MGVPKIVKLTPVLLKGTGLPVPQALHLQYGFGR